MERVAGKVNNDQILLYESKSTVITDNLKRVDITHGYLHKLEENTEDLTILDDSVMIVIDGSTGREISDVVLDRLLNKILLENGLGTYMDSTMETRIRVVNMIVTGNATVEVLLKSKKELNSMTDSAVVKCSR